MEQQEKQIIQLPSVQSLLLEMRFNGTQLGTATGFLLQNAAGRYFLVTNRHVVTGRHQKTEQPLASHGGVPNELAIWHNVQNQLGAWCTKTEPLYNADGEPLWKEHPTLGARADVVAIPLTDLGGVQGYPYDVHNCGEGLAVGIADPLSVVGFPFGLSGGGRFAIWATGFQATESIANYDDLPTLLIDCRSRSGQSGSPVIAYRSGGMIAWTDGSLTAGSAAWRLMGMYSGRINAESDLGIVWKLSVLKELMASV